METFKRHRTADEIITKCKAEDITFDACKYREGSDHIVMYLPGPNGRRCPVLFNVFNGRFFCAADGFPHFSSDKDQDDAWYQAMLDFFYTNEDPA